MDIMTRVVTMLIAQLKEQMMDLVYNVPMNVKHVMPQDVPHVNQLLIE